MARQIKNTRSSGEAAISLASLCAFAVLFLPPLRQVIFGSGSLVVLSVVLSGLAVTFFLLIRKFVKNANAYAGDIERQRILHEERRLRSFNLTTLEPVGNQPGVDAPIPREDQPVARRVKIAPGRSASRPEPEPTADAVYAAFARQVGASPVSPPNTQETNTLSANDIIFRLRAIDSMQFETVVALMYDKLGYEVDRRGEPNARGGIDLILEKEGERTAVQCKQWRGWKVPEKTVGDFAGILAMEGIAKGVFVIPGKSPDSAKQLAEARGIQVLDEEDLAQMLLAVGAHCDPEVWELLNG